MSPLDAVASPSVNPGPDVVTSTRHGVLHVVAAEPGPVRARLVFRIGMTDEAVQQRGLTHLVEHLVMRAVGRWPLETNAMTGAFTTTFEAVGERVAVTRFLEAVWAAVADLPTDALDLERTVLGHEARGAGPSPAVDAAHHRFGLTGPGRLWLAELGLAAATPGRLRAWARQGFVRGAAAVVSTVPLEPDLSPELGRGPGRALAEATLFRGGRGPVWVGDEDGTAVSLLLPTARGTDLAVGRLLLAASESAVRHDRALAYLVGLDRIGAGPEQTEVTVYAGCDPDDQAEVAGLMVGALRRLRDQGPGTAALEHDRATSRTVWTTMPDALELATEWATDLLVGSTPRSVADRLHDALALDGAMVRDAVQQAWSTVQVLLPGRTDPGIAGVQECRHDEPALRGRTRRANPVASLLPWVASPLPAGATLTTGEDGLTLRVGQERATVRWDGVAAVVRAGTVLTVLGQDGTTVPVVDGSVTGARTGRRAVEANVEEALFVDDPAHALP